MFIYWYFFVPLRWLFIKAVARHQDMYTANHALTPTVAPAYMSIRSCVHVI
jgi:hypothetical protein